MFDKLVNKYDLNSEKLSYKYYHSYRVMDNMIVLAKSMNLTIYDIKLASFIGLFHDYGRFEQYKRTNSFDDSLFDHGKYAAEYLKNNSYIMEYYGINKEDYEVVYKAIYYHNKYMIGDDLNKREMLFSKMIRDSDKLDILYALGNKDIKFILREDSSIISDIVKDSFYKEIPILNDNVQNANDSIICCLGFVYDINYHVTFDIINDKRYYEKIYERLNNKEIFKKYFDYIIKYIDERIC